IFHIKKSLVFILTNTFSFVVDCY
uniref:Uncharacterized protein n=1 Tax=Panagrolaimus sp. ES5 TaxID=591445 RepID=A0AC34GMT8_9BILA